MLSKLLVNFIITFENLFLRFISSILFYKRWGKERRKRILIFTSGTIGHFVQRIPAIKKIREIYPDARILMLCTDSSIKKVSIRYADEPEWLSFVDNLVDERLFIKGYKLLTKDSLKLARKKIKEFDPDMAFILDDSGAGFINKLKKMIYLWLIGLRCKVYGIKIAFDFNIKFLRNIYFRLGMIKNMMWGSLNAVYELKGIDRNFPGYSINIDMDKVRDEIKNINDENMVIIFCGGPIVKRWDAEKYSELIKRLKMQYNFLNFYLVGGKTEDDLVSSSAVYNLSSSLTRQNFCGQLNLIETSFIIKKAKLFIGNDGGLAHISSALGVKTIVIENAQNYPGHWWDNSPNTIIVRKKVDCEYCNAYPFCPTNTYKCIKDITVDEVEKAVKEFITPSNKNVESIEGNR
ncbi:MAG: glycosyltransferase family 9 protein [Candidatus Micrarchaeia archaeon]